MPEIVYQREIAVSTGFGRPERFTVSVAELVRAGRHATELIWSGAGIPQVVLARGARDRIIEMAVKTDALKLKKMADDTLAAAAGRRAVPHGPAATA